MSGKFRVMADESDDAVIERSVGIPAAFGAIFDRHSRLVYRYLRRRVGDDLAAELTAETFTRAFKGRDRYEPRDGSALPWLLGIATNLTRLHHRDEERRFRAYARAAAATPAEQVAATADLDDRVDAAALAPVLADALAALSIRQRDVLLLHAWAELSLAEIAVALDLPPATTRSHLHRARRSIESRLPEHARPCPEPTA